MARIDHVALECEDPQAVARFLTDVLGARIVETEGHPVMAYVGPTGFALHERGGTGLQVGVRVSEQERAAIRMRLDDLGVSHRERDQGIAVGLFFDDPEGHTIEAITYRSGDDPRRP